MTSKQPMYLRRAGTKRRAKLRSAEALRERLRVWLKERGATEEEPDAYNGVVEVILGGRWRLPLAKGALVVHLPADDDLGLGLDINTRFVDVEGAPHDKWSIALPSDANPYSGKWNFSCYDDEDLLFRTFTRAVERL